MAADVFKQYPGAVGFATPIQPFASSNQKRAGFKEASFAGLVRGFERVTARVNLVIERVASDYGPDGETRHALIVSFIQD